MLRNLVAVPLIAGFHSTQFQQERRVVLSLGASLDSPVEKDNSIEYFAPRASRSPPVLGSEWGHGNDIYLLIVVIDTGCGLSRQEMQKLFLRFSQASPKTHVKYGVRSIPTRNLYYHRLIMYIRALAWDCSYAKS